MLTLETPYITFFVVALAAFLILSIYLLSYQKRVLALRPISMALLTFSTFLFLGIACGKPFTTEPSSQVNLTALLDVSDSMDEGSSDALIDQLKGLIPPSTKLEIIPFAGEVAPIAASSQESFNTIKSAWGSLNLGQSNLEQAVLATSTLNNKKIILLSDGFENSGNVLATLQASSSNSSSAIYPLIPGENSRVSSRFYISNFHAPLVAATDKSVEVRTTIRNTSNVEISGELTVKHENKELLKKRIVQAANSETVFSAQSDPTLDGIKEVVATLTPDDSSLPTSVQRIFISGEQREKILLLNGTAQDGDLLSELFKNKAYKLVVLNDLKASTVFPALEDFSVIIVNNVAKTKLPENYTNKLVEFTKAGGQLVMIGGNQSFGLGGYIGTSIEDILPVRLLPPQKEAKRLKVAVSLVLDKSRSMDEGNKINYAKDAARSVIQNLKDDDLIQVVGFHAAPFVVVRMGRLRDIRAQALDRVGRLYPAGRTNLLPAIDEARRAMTQVEAGRKHVIVMTDGQIPQAGPYYTDLVTQMRRAGITVSSVLLGSDVDVSELKRISEIGGGAFYQTTNPASLANIFIKDIKVATGERTLKEEHEYLVRPTRTPLKSTTIEAFPPLTGFVQTRAREQADLELTVFSEDKAYPLLARWQVGKGNTLAFTSDANGRWSNLWARWPKFGRFWEEVVENLLPKDATQKSDKIKFDLKYGIDQNSLKLDLAVFDDIAPPTSFLELPNNTNYPVEWQTLAQGHYQAFISNPQAGKYLLKTSFAHKKAPPVAFYLSGELFGEKRGQGYAVPLLSKIASQTGGKLNPTRSEIASWADEITTKRDLTVIFLLLALSTFILEIWLREVRRKR